MTQDRDMTQDREMADKIQPNLILEDQDMEVVATVAGAPPYNDPNNPTAIGNQMFDLTEGQFGGPDQEEDEPGEGAEPLVISPMAEEYDQDTAESDQEAAEDDETAEEGQTSAEDDTAAEGDDMAAQDDMATKEETAQTGTAAESGGLESMSIAELRARATELEIPGRSGMTRQELITAIEEEETGQAETQVGGSSS